MKELRKLDNGEDVVIDTRLVSSERVIGMVRILRQVGITDVAIAGHLGVSRAALKKWEKRLVGEKKQVMQVQEACITYLREIVAIIQGQLDE